MALESGPDWLRSFQVQFGKRISKALVTESGSFLSEQDDGEQLGIIASRGRLARYGLADYNRQYWFRLFSVMQGEYPQTAGLLGFWNFNLLVHEFLQKVPPHAFDLGEVGKDFEKFIALQEDLPKRMMPRLAIVQAAQLDAAKKRVLSAAISPKWNLTPDEAQKLGELQLVASPCWEIVSENWPLLQLLLELREGAHEEIHRLPPAWESPRYWLLIMKDGNLSYLSLEPLQAQLYQSLRRMPIGKALEGIEQTGSHDHLYSSIQQWMSLSMELQLWMAGLNS